jgi:hypothetical protein
MKFRLPRYSKRDYLMLLTGGLIILLIVGVLVLVKSLQTPLAPESKTVSAKWLPSTVTHWHGSVEEMASKYDIDPNFIAIIMTMESGGNPKAKSESGAVGLMQITPPTAKDIAAKYLKKPVSKYNLQDPKTSIEFGAAYLAKLRDTFGEVSQGPNWNETAELVAAGYNGGPVASNHLQQGLGLHDTQTIVYSRDAFNMWRERNAKSSPTFDRWKERGGSILIADAAKNQ